MIAQQIWDEIRELQGIGTPDAMRVAAELSLAAEQGTGDEYFYKIVWYSDKCGGRLVRFKHDPRHKRLPFDEEETAEKEEIAVDVRLAASMSRTKRRIFEIAACNPWQWFFTGTLDGEKVDRNSLDSTYKRISQYFRDFRKIHSGSPLRYLIIPEQHKDGAWHFHGLIDGLSVDELHKFTLDEVLPDRIRKTISEGTEVYTWCGYAERFGYSTLTAVRDEKAVSRYVTKYITKDLLNRHEQGKKLYYSSRGLNKPTVIAEGMSSAPVPLSDFENDWVALTQIESAVECEMFHKQLFTKNSYLSC